MKCDIIIPVWNHLSFTKDCLESIKKNTHSDYRVLIVDNASDEQTRNYLHGLEASAHSKVTVIRNEENVGFIKAVNQGMRQSISDYVCLLNNDTIVTKGWLTEMVAVAESSKDIGIVNPSSNNLGQRPVSGEPIEEYAEKIRACKGRFVELGAAIGFCMLIKQEVIKKIGLFDEVYGMGNFEDTDFCRRAVQEGYRCVRACGSYVYHRENASFGKVRTFNEDFQRNREIYELRWGKPRRIAYILDGYDENILKMVRAQSMKLARDGNWVWCFLKEPLDLPNHSNIQRVGPIEKYFRAATLFRILKKKKRFDEIFVGDESLGRIFEKLAFIHKAKVRYY